MQETSPSISMTYGELIDLYIFQNDMYHYALAEMLGVTSDTISSYVNDETIPSYYKREKLKEIFGPEYAKLANYIEERDNITKTRTYKKQELQSD